MAQFSTQEPLWKNLRFACVHISVCTLNKNMMSFYTCNSCWAVFGVLAGLFACVAVENIRRALGRYGIYAFKINENISA